MIKRKPTTIIKFTEEEIEIFKKLGEIKCNGVKCRYCEAYLQFEQACIIVLCQNVAQKWEEKHGQHNND